MTGLGVFGLRYLLHLRVWSVTSGVNWALLLRTFPAWSGLGVMGISWLGVWIFIVL